MVLPRYIGYTSVTNTAMIDDASLSGPQQKIQVVQDIDPELLQNIMSVLGLVLT